MIVCFMCFYFVPDAHCICTSDALGRRAALRGVGGGGWVAGLVKLLLMPLPDAASGSPRLS